MKQRITAAELKAMTMKELAAWVEFNACAINRTMVMSWGHEELFKGYHIRPEYIGWKTGRLIVNTFHFTSRTRKADAVEFVTWLHWAIFGEYPAEEIETEETEETAEQVEETETEETIEETKEVVTMKKYFKVTFEYAEGIYCTNLAHAETAEDVEREYSKYPWKSIKEAQPWDVDESKMKGMPIIEVEPAQQPQEAPQESPAAEAEQQPTETENAPQAATQAAEGTDEKKEAETMTTTEREALERINARQNAANLFTNITPADIAAEMAAMEAEQAAPAPDPDAVTLAPADAAQVWDEDGNTITTEETTTDEQKEEEKPMSNPNKLYLSNWDYNAALIIEELAAIVKNNGGTVKPGTETIIENRALNENLRKAADRLTKLESIEAEPPGMNEKRTDAIKRLRADIEKWERIDNTPRTVHHYTWSSAYISFKLGGMYYYYQTDSNPFFDFHYQKTPIDINGTVSRCACLKNDPKEWVYDCFFRAEATDADRREAANLIYNMLVKAAPSVIRRDSHRVRVRNQYDGRYHYETVYEKERRETVNF